MTTLDMLLKNQKMKREFTGAAGKRQRSREASYALLTKKLCEAFRMETTITGAKSTTTGEINLESFAVGNLDEGHMRVKKRDGSLVPVDVIQITKKVARCGAG